MRAVAVQLMEVVYGVKDNDWLVKLLRGMISGPGAGDKQKKVHTAFCSTCLCIYIPQSWQPTQEKLSHAKGFSATSGPDECFDAPTLP